MKKQLEIIHEFDTDEGRPQQWRIEINHYKFGKYCWINDMRDYYEIEVIYNGVSIELAICKSLSSAKRWVELHLL